MQALHSLHVSLIKHTLEQKQVPNDFISGDSKNTDEGVQYQRHPKCAVLRASRTQTRKSSIRGIQNVQF